MEGIKMYVKPGISEVFVKKNLKHGFGGRENGGGTGGRPSDFFDRTEYKFQPVPCGEPGVSGSRETFSRSSSQRSHWPSSGSQSTSSTRSQESFTRSLGGGLPVRKYAMVNFRDKKQDAVSNKRSSLRRVVGKSASAHNYLSGGKQETTTVAMPRSVSSYTDYETEMKSFHDEVSGKQRWRSAVNSIRQAFSLSSLPPSSSREGEGMSVLPSCLRRGSYDVAEAGWWILFFLILRKYGNVSV